MNYLRDEENFITHTRDVGKTKEWEGHVIKEHTATPIKWTRPQLTVHIISE